MKEYKVGDTVYLKGVVKQISGTFDTGSNYKIPDDLLISNCQIIDELPTAEPVKPVLPKAVADELKSAKKCGLHFVGYMNWALDGDSPMTYSYIFKRGNNNDNIKVMADAWYNGYTVEKEPTWCIEVPGKFNRPTYYAINDGALAFGYLDEDKKWYRDYSAHAFTDEEISKFGLQDCEKELVADDNED